MKRDRESFFIDAMGNTRLVVPLPFFNLLTRDSIERDLERGEYRWHVLLHACTYRHGDGALADLELGPNRGAQRTLCNNGDVGELQWMNGLKVVDLNV